jgi:hypothetical protein
VSVSKLKGADGQLVLLAFSAALLLQLAAGIMMPIYRAVGRFNRALVLEQLLIVARILAVAAASLAGAGPVGASAAYLAMTAVVMLGIVPLDLARNLEGARLRPALPTRAESGELLRVAPWFYCQHVAGVL